MINLRQLCQIGFKCPYYGCDEDGDEVCLHPYTRENCPEDEQFYLIDDTGDCPLLEFESELYDVLCAYHYDREKLMEFSKIQNLRWDRESRHGRYAEEYYERVAVKAYLDYRRLYDA